MNKKLYCTISFLVIAFLFALDFVSADSSSVDAKTYDVYVDSVYIGSVGSREIVEDYIDREISILNAKSEIGTVYPPENYAIIESPRVEGDFNEYETLDNFKNMVDFSVEGYKATIFLTTPNEFILGHNKSFVIPEELTEENFKELNDDEIDELIDEEGIDSVTIYTKTKEDLEEGIADYIRLFVSDEEIEMIELGEYPTDIGIGNKVVIGYDVFANVYVEESLVAHNLVLSKEDVTNYLLYQDVSDAKDTYTVKNGEDIESVAFANKMTSTMLLLSNPDLTEDTILAEGENINVKHVNPVIDIATVELVVFEQTIDYNEIEKQDTTKYKSYKVVTQEGVKGLNHVTYEIVHVNGRTTNDSKLIETKEIVKAVDEVVVVGTKELVGYTRNEIDFDILSGTGNWSWPTVGGYISQGYHYGHRALDIAGQPTGSALRSVDSGTVIVAESSGYNGGYGLYVVVDHGNGYVSYYAHMNRVDVSVGQNVSSGQLLGGMGNTGLSFGIHLHIEITYNGSKIDPCKVLGC